MCPVKFSVPIQWFELLSIKVWRQHSCDIDGPFSSLIYLVTMVILSLRKLFTKAGYPSFWAHRTAGLTPRLLKSFSLSFASALGEPWPWCHVHRMGWGVGPAIFLSDATTAYTLLAPQNIKDAVVGTLKMIYPETARNFRSCFNTF